MIQSGIYQLLKADASIHALVADRIFAIEGPMTDDRPWIAAARHAREDRRQDVVCGPRGTDRAALAAEFAGTEHMRGVPPGSIVRPRWY